MRICQIELHNFRGIKEGKVILPKHAVLLGANNAGKTTIIEASLFFSAVKGWSGQYPIGIFWWFASSG